MSRHTPSTGTLPTDAPMDVSLGDLHALLRQRQPRAGLVGDGTGRVQRICSDTRQVQAGDLFVAIRGERFDGNTFVAQAQAAGASASLAHRGILASPCRGIEVDDTLAALGDLAALWRGRFDLPLIAVTGSNGKTTVTQMLASILRAWDDANTLATVGNFNNAIGLPLTLLRLRPHHKAAVVELGMNHPGEIAQLASMAAPTVALVNNAQREHQEFMHSIEAVARENASVFAALPLDGIAVFPHDDPYTGLWRELAGGRTCMSFGERDGADVRLRTVQWQRGAWHVQAETPAGPMVLALRMLGRHNVRNALAAMACAAAAGLPATPIVRGLEVFQAVGGRMRTVELLRSGGPVTLVDDAYNANPDSVRAAIAALADLPGPRLLVLGDMGEVGTQGPAFHEEVGHFAREQGVEQVIGLGPLTARATQAFGRGGLHFGDIKAVLGAVDAALEAGVQSVLVKGARSMAMERVVAALEHGAVAQEAPSC